MEGSICSARAAQTCSHPTALMPEIAEQKLAGACRFDRVTPPSSFHSPNAGHQPVGQLLHRPRGDGIKVARRLGQVRQDGLDPVAARGRGEHVRGEGFQVRTQLADIALRGDGGGRQGAIGKMSGRACGDEGMRTCAVGACGKEGRAGVRQSLSPHPLPHNSPSRRVNIVEDGGLAGRLVRRGCAGLHCSDQKLDQAQRRGLEGGRKGGKRGEVG